jgi:hypothetical protein
VSVTIVHTHTKQLRYHSGSRAPRRKDQRRMPAAVVCRASAERSASRSFGINGSAKAGARPIFGSASAYFGAGKMTPVSSIRHDARRYGAFPNCSGRSSMLERTGGKRCFQTRLSRCVNVIQRGRHGQSRPIVSRSSAVVAHDAVSRARARVLLDRSLSCTVILSIVTRRQCCAARRHSDSYWAGALSAWYFRNP